MRNLMLLAFMLSTFLVNSESAIGKSDPLNPFFAFSNCAARDQLTPMLQVAALKEMGYDGIGYTGTDGIQEMLAAIDKFNLKLFSLYVRVDIGPNGPRFDPGLPEAIKLLRKRQTIIWLYVIGNCVDAEQQTVRIVREISDLAAQSKLKVATYPHTGFYIAKIEDSVRIAKKIKRTNVGASFNLCHWLKNDGGDLAQRFKEAVPYLYLVSINGADSGDTHNMGWDRLIQPLGQGTYDVKKLIKQLRNLGYKGPIGLQCYNLPGDYKMNLLRSMKAWKKLNQ